MAEPGGVPDYGTLGQSRSTCLSKLHQGACDSVAWSLGAAPFGVQHKPRFQGTLIPNLLSALQIPLLKQCFPPPLTPQPPAE